MKKFIPVTAFMGLLPAALLCAASTASAVGPTGHYTCSMALANVVSCKNMNAGPAVVKITGSRIPTRTELGVLAKNLDKAPVNFTALRNMAVSTYNSANPKVKAKTVSVCIRSACR